MFYANSDSVLIIGNFSSLTGHYAHAVLLFVCLFQVASVSGTPSLEEILVWVYFGPVLWNSCKYTEFVHVLFCQTCSLGLKWVLVSECI